MRIVGIPTTAATDAEVTAAVAAVIASAPAALDTLLELAAAINNDAAFSTTVSTALALKLALGGGTMSGTLVMADQILQRPELKDYAETVSAHGNIGSTETIDYEAGNVHTGTADANCTFTFSNPPATGKAGSFTLILSADGSVRTHVWPASVKWAAAAAPTMTGTSGKIDILSFITLDAGTSWLGLVAGQNL